MTMMGTVIMMINDGGDDDDDVNKLDFSSIPKGCSPRVRLL